MSEPTAQTRFKRQYRTALDAALAVSIIAHLVIFAVCPPFASRTFASPEPEVPILVDLYDPPPVPPPPPPIAPPRVPTIRLAAEYVAVPEPETAPDPPLPPPPPLAAGLPAPSPRFESWDRPPRVRHTPFDPDRDYPPTARSAGMEGTVLLRVQIDERGRVASAEVVHSDSPVFDQAALRLVRKWEFEPAEQAGNPVSAVVLVPLSFRLGRDTVGQR